LVKEPGGRAEWWPGRVECWSLIMGPCGGTAPFLASET